MFGKLLKYDFRSMIKQFAFIWPAALALALVNHFTINSFVTSASEARQTFSGIAMLVYVAILMAMFIVALVFTIQRFYKGLLGDEGYLMHTLPVKPWQLIGSKLLCAVVTTFISILIAIFSIFIIFPWGLDDFQEILKMFQYVFSHWNMQATHGVIGILEFILMMLVSFAAGYLQIYLALSIGHLFNKSRIAMSVIAFIAINAVVSGLLGSFLASVLEPLANMIEKMEGVAGVHAAMWTVTAGGLVLSAVYFVGTEFILRKKLNLE